MNERIKQVRKHLGFNQETFASKIGLTKNYISLVENGSRSLSEQSMRIMCAEFGIREEWLRTGTGQMLMDSYEDQRLADFMGSIMATEPYQFKRQLITALSNMSDEGWVVLEDLVNSIIRK